MTIGPEELMAYADDALDPLRARRVEAAIAADPALGAEVERHRALRRRLEARFAPIAAEPVPARLAALIPANVVALPPVRRRPTWWQAAAAMAACLVAGVTIGRMVDRGPVGATSGGLYARGALARALDDQPGGATADGVRVALSFRDHAQAYCRVFAAPVADGIACRDQHGWALRRTMPGTTPRGGGDYAQAGSSDAELMAAAQDMMAGEALDAAGERAARARGWR